MSDGHLGALIGLGIPAVLLLIMGVPAVKAEFKYQRKRYRKRKRKAARRAQRLALDQAIAEGRVILRTPVEETEDA